METIQSRLSWARKRAKLSQAKIAEMVGISQPTYSDLERGDSKSSVWLVEIARALNVSPRWLASGEGSFEPADTESQPLVGAKLSPAQQLLLDATEGFTSKQLQKLIKAAGWIEEGREIKAVDPPSQMEAGGRDATHRKKTTL